MIRPIQATDRFAVAQLLTVIFEDMELTLLTKLSKTEITQMVVEAMADPTYRYHDARGILIEIDQEVAGVLFGYEAADETVIDNAWETVTKRHQLTGDTRLFKDPEAFPNEWYIDSICVAEKFRGRGLGTQLLEALYQIAAEKGTETVGLCCDFSNTRARSLYERQGFEVVGEQVLSHHRYYHMQKQLSF